MTKNAGGTSFALNAMTLDDTPRARLDEAAAAIYAIFAAREREFGFGEKVVVEYPSIDRMAGGFRDDPVGHIAARLAELDRGEPVSRVVALTTFGEEVRAPLVASGYAAARIDMPAGPDHTYTFTCERGAPGRTLYLEAVDEEDETIRPTFALSLFDDAGRLCGGACGAVRERDGACYAYLATLTLVAGLPAGTGTRLAAAMLDRLRAEGVTAVHLGTQTAGRFYEKLGFRVTHRLVEGLRTRVSEDGRRIEDDLVMLALDL